MSTITEVNDGELREIALAELFESAWNPRQYYPDGPMNELVESMKQSGFRSWLPLMVRRRGEGGYEIGAGHRRSRAAREAGIDSVPCIVRDMTDAEFLDVLNFDNCGREDVHPLHEASGWQAWMEKTGKGVLDIAARIGQSKEYVYQRLKYSSLIPEARRVFMDGAITAGHAVLIARVPCEEDQKKALKFCQPRWDGTRPGVRQLAEFISRDIHLGLDGAAFDLESESLLPAAGSCSACSKRTGNSPPLVIPELEEVKIPAAADEEYDFREEDEPDEDRCTDPACFSAKLDAHLVQIKAKLAEKGKVPIAVAGGYGKAAKGILSRNAYCEVPKGPDATVAIVADGINAGKVIHIKLLSDDRKEESERRKKEDEAREAKLVRERAVRLKILEGIRAKTGARLAKWEVSELIEMLLGETTIPCASELCRMRGIPVPGAKPNQPSYDADDQGTDALIAGLSSLSEAEMFRLVIELPLMNDFESHAMIRNDPAKKLMAAAKSYGVDAIRIRREVEEKLKAAEGGVRREVEKPGQPEKAKKAPAKKKAAPKTAAKKKAATKKPSKR